MHTLLNNEKNKHHNWNAMYTGLGIDIGGTQTRWALADVDGRIVAEGAALGATALQLSSAEGHTSFQTLFTFIADQITNMTGNIGRVNYIQTGLTGFNGESQELKKMVQTIFSLPDQFIQFSNDIEIAYHDAFKLGEGFLVYSGTGSIAAYIDESGQFHRAGGLGFVLDDAGSGYWIAREALKRIWREEDFNPGAWRSSAMAKAVFEYIGGSDWKHSREFIYQKTRGEVGLLARALATSAEEDKTAYQILEQAGVELARLASALCHRFGFKPVALSGRVQELHPVIIQAMKQHLPKEVELRSSQNLGHYSAARIASSRIIKA